MHFQRLLSAAAILVLIFASACGARRPVPTTPSGDDATRLDPIHMRATGDGDQLTIEAYTAESLFAEAVGYHRAENCREALPRYLRLYEEFKASNVAPAALYNAGLCFEKTDELDRATERYLTLIELFPGSDDRRDALFQLAGVYEKLEAWDKAVAAFDKILFDSGTLPRAERVEAEVRKGAALVQLRELDHAETVLKDAARRHRLHSDLDDPSPAYHYAMAYFKLGDILHIKMRAVELPPDETRIESALEDKCQLLLDAQAEYTRAIKAGHPHWAAAAAYRIGALYRNLWDDLLSAPPPSDLDDEAREVYLEVLRDRVRVLLRKAIRQWERVLKMAARLELSNEWVNRTKSDLEEIRRLLLKDQSRSLPEEPPPPQNPSN